MKALEFDATMTPNGEIILPSEYVADIPAGQQLRVLVLWDSDSADSVWRQAGRRSFEDAYCGEDSVYEGLADDAAGR